MTILNKKNNTFNDTIIGHPKGLFVLFFTEMWERFSYYGMRAILVMFLTTATIKGGFGWSQSQSIELYGFYSMFVYLTGILGGFIADRYLGLKLSVLCGCIFQCLGHFLLALTIIFDEIIFFIGLIFLVIGCGLIKPNISTMVGLLYKKDDIKRDSGFTIFYMGVNLGALFAPLVVGWVGEKISWHYGFGIAGIGMVISILTFILGQKYLHQIPKEINAYKEKLKLTDLIKSFTKKEKERLLLLLIIFIFLGIFFIAFEQSAGLLILYAQNHTNRNFLNINIPASWLQGCNPLFVVCLAPIISIMWEKISKSYKYISPIHKVAAGNIIIGLSFLFMIAANLQEKYQFPEESPIYWLIITYLFQTVGELCLSPVSMAFVTKLSPKRVTSLVMGIYFSIFGIANYLSAKIGKMAFYLGELTIFEIIFFITIMPGILLIFFSKKLIKLANEKNN